MKLRSWDLPSLAPVPCWTYPTQGTIAGTLCHSSHFGMCPLQTASPQADQVFSWGSVHLVSPEKLKKKKILLVFPPGCLSCTSLLFFYHPSSRPSIPYKPHCWNSPGSQDQPHRLPLPHLAPRLSRTLCALPCLPGSPKNGSYSPAALLLLVLPLIIMCSPHPFI